MLRPDIETAHVEAPVRGGSSADWLLGKHSGQRVFIVGGAKGLVEHPGLSALRGAIVIGTNWTLELLDPTYLQIADAPVWKHQQAKISRSKAVVLATTGVFGGGVYSSKSPNLVRQLGAPSPHVVKFKIGVPTRGYRDPKTGHYHRTRVAPYLPDRVMDFHYSGNSLGYAMQWANLMGASEVLLMGFTLEAGSGYFFSDAPPTKASNRYDVDRILDFVRFVNQERPGWAKLVEGWSGPLYDCGLEVVDAALGATKKAPVRTIKAESFSPWS